MFLPEASHQESPAGCPLAYQIATQARLLHKRLEQQKEETKSKYGLTCTHGFTCTWAAAVSNESPAHFSASGILPPAVAAEHAAQAA